METNVLDNAYTSRDFEYLKSKSSDVCIIVRNKVTQKVSIKSTLPLADVQKLLSKEMGSELEERWVSEAQREKFPKSPGPLGEIFANRAKLQQYSSKIMTFWHGVRGRQAMGVGTFEAWDTFEMDMGQVPTLVDQLDKVREALDSFTIKMSDVIEWQDLAGIHGIGSGNLKKVKIDWTWLEVLKFLIIWSYAVAGVSIEDNVNETWSPNADDFEDKKQFKVGLVKKKTLTKMKCSPAQKEAGRKKGIQRAKASLFKTKDGDYEMAMALSVSAEIEKEREAEKVQESEDMAKALSLSMNERTEDILPAER